MAGTPRMAGTSTTASVPDILQNHRISKIWLATGSGLICLDRGCTGSTVGPDGSVWAADPQNHLVYQETMAGVVTSFTMPTGFFPAYLATGPDGDLYVSGNGADYVIRMTTSGTIARLPIPSHDRTFSDGIVGGATAVWFVEGAHLGRITPDGTVTEYAYQSHSTTNNGAGITIDERGQPWFVDTQAQTLGLFNNQAGALQEFPSGTLSGCVPYDILSAAGFFWVGCGSPTPALAKVTTHAKVTIYTVAIRVGQTPQSMAVGPNGDPWMVTPIANALSDFDPKTNAMTTYLPPLRMFLGPTLTLAPDGNLWMASDDVTNIFLHNVLTVTPKKTVLSGPGATGMLAVKERGTSSWTAASSDTSVATVSQGSMNWQFVVTAVASGACTVTIADAIGNSYVVSVVVD